MCAGAHGGQKPGLWELLQPTAFRKPAILDVLSYSVGADRKHAHSPVFCWTQFQFPYSILG